MLEKKIIYKRDGETHEQWMGEADEQWWNTFRDLHGIEIIEIKEEFNVENVVKIPDAERLEALEMLMVDILGGGF